MRKFRGGQFSKRNLVEADGIQAAIDDDLLNVPFKVLSFELTFYDSMGNIIPEVTQGNQFSQRQKIISPSGKRQATSTSRMCESIRSGQ
ncbi:MAG: GldM family protein [Parabacteroides merdae]